MDDDGDGFVDCLDLGCSLNPAVTVCAADSERSDRTCSDGEDNDGDGRVDCADFDCSRNPNVIVCAGDAEDSDARCSDGEDNDGDGFTDCEDFECARNPFVAVCGGDGGEDGDAACSNGVDDDGDGLTDCEDNDCALGDGVTVCGGGGSEDTNALSSDGGDTKQSEEILKTINQELPKTKGATRKLIDNAQTQSTEFIESTKRRARRFAELLPKYKENPEFMLTAEWTKVLSTIFSSPTVEVIVVGAGEQKINIQTKQDPDTAARILRELAKVKNPRGAAQNK